MAHAGGKHGEDDGNGAAKCVRPSIGTTDDLNKPQFRRALASGAPQG